MSYMPSSSGSRSKNPMYKIEGGFGRDGKGFVRDAQKLYKENKTKLQGMNKPTSIKASINMIKKLGMKVYFKEDGWAWSTI